RSRQAPRFSAVQKSSPHQLQLPPCLPLRQLASPRFCGYAAWAFPLLLRVHQRPPPLPVPQKPLRLPSCGRGACEQVSQAFPLPRLQRPPQSPLQSSQTCGREACELVSSASLRPPVQSPEQEFPLLPLSAQPLQ